jgi:uncharacterized protein (DUF2225 family)
MADKKEKDNPKVSYSSKEEFTCPACGEKFHREELLSGSGRLIAGELTDELHRLYEPTEKYGRVYPLVYVATVCPQCLFASGPADFSKLPKDAVEKVQGDAAKRRHELRLICDDWDELDFTQPRTLEAGAVSQYLALRCYDYFPLDVSPTIKQALAALRAGWLFDYLNEEKPGHNYDWLAKAFKKKSAICYSAALEREAAGKETLSALDNFGPDTDKNYAYEGALYMAAMLNYKYGPRNDNTARLASLDEGKRDLAKLFGSGKSSKAKPGSILEKAKALYESIGNEISDLGGS